MPNVKFKLGMDNRVRPGQDTRNQILAALQAQGIPALAAEPAWDPITGELVQTYVNVPDTASVQASAAINANSGVAVATPPIPDPLFIYDLTGITLTGVTGMQDGGTGEQDDSIRVDCQPLDLVLQGTYAGVVSGAGATYADGEENVEGFQGSIIEIRNNPQASSANIVIPSGTGKIQLAYDGKTLDLTHFAISVGRASTAKSVVHMFWVGLDGKLYLARRLNDLYLPDVPLRTYEEAIAFGPV